MSIPENHHIIFKKDKNGNEIACVFQIQKGKTKHVVRFKYENYNGKENALRLAKKERDEYLKKHNIDINKRYNRSGIIGVSRTEDKRKSKTRAVWQASWNIDKKQYTVPFAVSVYGEEGAKTMAIEARKAAENSLKENKITSFIHPSDPNVKIWRYMDFTKFVSMSINGGLFFPIVDILGDPFEGSYSRGNNRIRDFVYSRSENKQKLNELIELIKQRRKYICINCWHMSDYESAAMWKLYSQSNEAICIQSTFKKLKTTLKDDVNFGVVNYIDYEKDWIKETDIYYPFLHKRVSFEHEKELRAIIDIANIVQKDAFINSELEKNKGLWKYINLKSLISNIYISPESPNWFQEVVTSYCHEVGLKTPIKSLLDSQPLH